MDPAVQRTRRRFRPRRAEHHGGARRRRLDRQRAEGLEYQRPPRRLRNVAGPHRLGRPQAPGHQLLRAADETTRRRGAPDPADEPPLVVQRGVPDQRPYPGDKPGRRSRRRLASRQDDPDARADLCNHATPVVRWQRPDERSRSVGVGSGKTGSGDRGGRRRGRGSLRDIRLVSATSGTRRPHRRTSTAISASR